MLNESHWINASCLQQGKECSDAWENKVPGGYSEGHLLTQKNQFISWLPIQSLYPSGVCVYVCVCVCVCVWYNIFGMSFDRYVWFIMLGEQNLLVAFDQTILEFFAPFKKKGLKHSVSSYILEPLLYVPMLLPFTQTFIQFSNSSEWATKMT